MRLPPVLVDALQEHMGDHGMWHMARWPEQWFSEVDRTQWREAKDHFNKPPISEPPIPVTEVGSGRQFLEFHRMMLRHFKWILLNTPGHNHELRPWTAVPDWLKADPAEWRGFSTRYLDRFSTRVLFLIEDPDSTDEMLGGFLESNELDTSKGRNFHNLCHGFVAAFETRQNTPGNLVGAEMDDFATAHYNEHFWNLHAWLDNLYGQWQEKHHEVVDQSPMNPHGDDDHEHVVHSVKASPATDLVPVA